MNQEKLLLDWLNAKSTEESARSARVEIEKQILAFAPKKDDGSLTTKYGNFKLVVTQEIKRKFDATRWPEVEKKFPSDLKPVCLITTCEGEISAPVLHTLKAQCLSVEQDLVLDEKGIKFLKENRPDLYSEFAAACLTETPYKPGVKVTIDKEE